VALAFLLLVYEGWCHTVGTLSNSAGFGQSHFAASLLGFIFKKISVSGKSRDQY